MSKASNTPSVREDLRILREALEHVRYRGGDGYTPSRVAAALDRLEARLVFTGNVVMSEVRYQDEDRSFRWEPPEEC